MAFYKCFKCGKAIDPKKEPHHAIRPKGGKTRYYHKECTEVILLEWQIARR